MGHEIITQAICCCFTFFAFAGIHLRKFSNSTLEEEFLLFEIVPASLSFLGMFLVLCDASLSQSNFLHPRLLKDYKMSVSFWSSASYNI